MTYTARLEAAVEERIRELARAASDGRETGGILLGRGPDEHGVIVVEEAGDAGDHAERRPDYFLRDRAHAERLAEIAWERSRAVWVGEWHTHPNGLPIPSTRDLATYSALLDDSELAFKALVSVIAVPDPAQRWQAPRLLVWVLAPTLAADVSHADGDG
jgi:integrative and conjugative element protein (TIGR02256 family)